MRDIDEVNTEANSRKHCQFLGAFGKRNLENINLDK